jgi:hypothetical protein
MKSTPPILELLNIAVKNQIEVLRKEFKRDPNNGYFERLIELNSRKFQDPYNGKISLSLAEYICAYADVFMFGSDGAKEAHIPKHLFILLTHALALMAFAPGGVSIFGYHWKS